MPPLARPRPQVGDNPAADIRGANLAGPPWRSVLVRTGVFAGGANSPSDPAHAVVEDVLAAVKVRAGGLRGACAADKTQGKLAARLHGLATRCLCPEWAHKCACPEQARKRALCAAGSNQMGQGMLAACAVLHGALARSGWRRLPRL
jgi:hypothetical protein